MRTDDLVTELAVAQRRLRRRALLIAGVGALLVAAAAGALWRSQRPAPYPPPIERPYLWRVDGAHPSYLLGTVHVEYGFDDLPASVHAAFAGATTVVVESDLLQPARPAPPPASPDAPPDAPGGRDRLTADEWARLARLTEVPEAALVGVTSSKLLGGVLAAQTRRIEPMDRGIQARATAARKAVVFLEDRDLTAITTADDQAVISEATVLAQLRQAIAQPQALRAGLRRIVRAYADGGPQGCASVSGAGLVDQLNDDWLAAIVAAVDRGDAFVAIGCAHLVGADGVVARLAARGYAVTRIAR
ncbi:MAG: TraB/GumN family protein [Myxococcales bacterium]|nr:TraB/GumN family protein [Myxococcales bacterium]